jgi:alpha-D-xyloside xylohydrolase
MSKGVPDKFTPQTFRAEPPVMTALSQLPAASLPFDVNDISIRVTGRGCIVEIPLSADEQLYGFGMQIRSFNQKGLRKRPIVNDRPVNDVGYTHAPVPMYVSTKGYAILINTLRYTTFYCGANPRREGARTDSQSVQAAPALSAQALYMSKEQGSGNMIVDIPGASGIEVICFSGPDMKTAIRRYILYSGGGVLPPIEGLGIKYRVKSDFNERQVLQAARYFRDNDIPCDVIGLEPGWQTASYSCSYVWDRNKFPDPARLADSLRYYHFGLNLWEHAFVNSRSPLYRPLLSRSGDFPVWKGLVPDFADSLTRHIFTQYHDTAIFSKGVTGLKLDECDNSDLGDSKSSWSFPEASTFPSGISGEQLHQTFGNLYLQGFYERMKRNNRRALFDIRMLGTFAAPYPAVLYSDIYEHENYIRMIPNSGFCGILWSPEVREASSIPELIHRAQTAVLSAQTVFNSWYLRHPPWLQYDTERNNADSLHPEGQKTEHIIRQLFRYRMQLVPYLYQAFFRYATEGVPPFRALVIDYPADSNVFNLDNEYLIGERLLAAPLLNDDSARTIYLPAGDWYDFHTHQRYAGNKKYVIQYPPERLPLFVKGGTVLPLAQPVSYLDPARPLDITCFIFGKGDADATLLEDDGQSFDYKNGKYNLLLLTWKNGKGKVSRSGNFKGKMYHINKWVQVQ